MQTQSMMIFSRRIRERVGLIGMRGRTEGNLGGLHLRDIIWERSGMDWNI